MIRTSFDAPVLNERFILTFGDCSEADGSQTFNLMTLPKGSVVKGVRIKQTAAFTGGGAGAVTCSVGSAAGAVDSFAAAFDIFQAPGDQVAQMSAGWKAMTYAADTLTATIAANVNVNALLTGAVCIDVEILLMPDLTATAVPPGTGGGYV